MDHDATLLNEVVIPLMNVNRRTIKGLVNKKEPHMVQYYLTSAGQKSSYAYEKLIELFSMQIYNPKAAFVWGCSYKVPMMYGLLTKDNIQDIKLASTYKDDSFARELTPKAHVKILKLLETPESQINYNKNRKINCECFKNYLDWIISSQAA
jgi:hypothetical protein